VYQYRRYLGYAFLFFTLFTLIGLLSGIYDKDFAKVILGEEYVNRPLKTLRQEMR
jgi:hypothetical protein